jgi:hypothetical protein
VGGLAYSAVLCCRGDPQSDDPHRLIRGRSMPLNKYWGFFKLRSIFCVHCRRGMRGRLVLMMLLVRERTRIPLQKIRQVWPCKKLL